MSDIRVMSAICPPLQVTERPGVCRIAEGWAETGNRSALPTEFSHLNHLLFYIYVCFHSVFRIVNEVLIHMWGVHGHVSLCACLYAVACAHLCVNMWRPDVNTGCFLQPISDPFSFSDRVLCGSWRFCFIRLPSL